jgi:hypothetical protein
MHAWRREGMAFPLAALDGSGGNSPLFAFPFRPLIRLREPSLCRALTARKDCHVLREGGCMSTFVGIDVAKEVHWVCAIDLQGQVLLNRRLLSTQRI